MIPRNSNKGIIYEAEEIKGEGCCFSGLVSRQREAYLMNPSRIRVYSEPKEPKGKKIELVTPKKGLSQGKQTSHTSGSVSHQKIAQQLHEKIGTPKSIVTFNYNSKITTQKSSLKNSKIAPNNNLKPNRPSNEKNHHLSPCNKIQVNSEYRPYEQLPQKFQGLEYISEISLVSEQFISQASAANIANLINNQQKIGSEPQNNNNQQSLRQYIYASCFQQKQRKNPIERIMDRKRYEVKAQNRKKKIVV